MNATSAPQVNAAQLLRLQLLQQRAINSLAPHQPSSQSETVQRLLMSVLAQSKPPVEVQCVNYTNCILSLRQTPSRGSANTQQPTGLNAEALMRYESMEASDKRRKYISQVQRANTVDDPSVSDTVTPLTSSAAAAAAVAAVAAAAGRVMLLLVRRTNYAVSDARAQPFRHSLHTMGMSVDSGACGSSTSSSFDQGSTQRQAYTSVENMLLAQITKAVRTVRTLSYLLMLK